MAAQLTRRSGPGRRIAAATLALSLATGFTTLAEARGGGGGGGAGSGMGGSGSMGGPGDIGDQDRLHSQERMQDRIREMDRLRDRLHQTPDSAERQRLMNAYRQHIQSGMQTMRMRAGEDPAPTADPRERLRQMEQQQEHMQQMMRHMWEFERLEGGTP